MMASNVGSGRGGGGSRGGLRVKNKSPAPVQITAEQLLREAADRATAETAVVAAPPK
jgi:hypothetical protein